MDVDGICCFLKEGMLPDFIAIESNAEDVIEKQWFWLLKADPFIEIYSLFNGIIHAMAFLDPIL